MLTNKKKKKFKGGKKLLTNRKKNKKKFKGGKKLLIYRKKKIQRFQFKQYFEIA